MPRGRAAELLPLPHLQLLLRAIAARLARVHRGARVGAGEQSASEIREIRALAVVWVGWEGGRGGRKGAARTCASGSALRGREACYQRGNAHVALCLDWQLTAGQV